MTCTVELCPKELMYTEAYEDYGVPYALDVWEKFLF